MPRDEEGSFVAKEQANCDPDDPKGDWWDHVASDPEHRRALALAPGARSIGDAEGIVGAVRDRLGGRAPESITSDEDPAAEPAIEANFAAPVPPVSGREPGRRPLIPPRRVPVALNCATGHKQRGRGRVVAILTAVALGTRQAVTRALECSRVSRSINTSLLERQHGADRGRNARKSRRTYRFSKGWRMHEAMTSFTRSRDHFCGPVRTLRVRDQAGCWPRRV